MAFEANLESELLSLTYDINHGLYRHGDYEHKIINEKKRRDIYVAEVRDRVVHRLIYDYLVPLLNHRFDPDVWSCRLGKGLYGALGRTQQLARAHDGGWVYRADVRKFFDNVDQAVLRVALLRHVTDQKAMQLIDQTLASYDARDARIGMPIGNLTSQLFANVYLNEFDRHVRHTVKPHGYVRYGDDIVLFGASRQHVMAMGQQCEDFLKHQLFLQVHPTGTHVLKIASGIRFLGHYIYPESIVVAPSLRRKVRREVTVENLTSYQAHALPRRLRRDLIWMMLDD